MAPKITDGTEVRFSIDNKQNMLVRSLTPKTNSDFVTSTAGGAAQDQGVLSKNSNAGVAIDGFYTGAAKVKDVPASTSVFVRNSVGQPVVLVQLEKK